MVALVETKDMGLSLNRGPGVGRVRGRVRVGRVGIGVGVRIRVRGKPCNMPQRAVMTSAFCKPILGQVMRPRVKG